MVKGLIKSYALPQGVTFNDICNRILIHEEGTAGWYADVDIAVDGMPGAQQVQVRLNKAAKDSLADFRVWLAAAVKKEMGL
jgi:hypothetical protein